MPDTPFLLLFTFFSNARFLNFFSLNVFKYIFFKYVFKKLNKIQDDKCFFLFLYECMCNTKVTTILFYICRTSNMLYINNITK